MSLTRLAQGYTGEAVAFEGVSEESLAKYDLTNGPVTMALEAAQLLTESFMDGIYTPNDLVMEAAQEGYSSVQESGKMEAIKEKLKKAGSSIAEMFRKMGNAIRAFCSNIANKIKLRSSEAAAEIKKTNASELEYEGYKYTHLEDLGKILKECTPESIYGKTRVFKRAISGDVKSEKGVSAADYREEMEKALTDLKAEYKIGPDDVLSSGLAKYFRDGKNGETATQKIKTSEAIKIANHGNAAYSTLDSISSKIKKDYDNYADKCDKLAKKADDKDGDTSAEVETWHAIASGIRAGHSFASFMLTAWSNAYAEALSAWVAAAKASGSNDSGNDNE